MRIAPADLAEPQVAALVAAHQAALAANSPPGLSFALDASGLADPAITLLGVWEGDRLAGIGALKQLSPGHAEIKSMRTADAFLRRGVARRMLSALLDLARERGVARVSLETGTTADYAPAVALYRGFGFANGAAFADYELTDFNQCLHLDLAPGDEFS